MNYHAFCEGQCEICPYRNRCENLTEEDLIEEIKIEKTENLKQKNIRQKIDIGNIVRYKNKEYIIINFSFTCGGNIMYIEMIRKREINPMFKLVKRLYDEEIEKLEILSN